MLFDTPKTLEAALHLIALYDQMYWNLYDGCSGAVRLDNTRIEDAKREGRKAHRSAIGLRALKAMKTCDRVVEDTRRWMQARELGGQRPIELACSLFLKAERMAGPARTALFADLNALLDQMDPDEWAYAVMLDARYGRDAVTRICLHAARRRMAKENVA